MVAQGVVYHLTDKCVRIEIAGSVRRKRKDVGDIEIVCIPQVVRPQTDLFGNDSGPMKVPLYNHVRNVDWLRPRLNSMGKPQAMGKRYMAMIDICTGIPIDIFIVLPPAQWGVIMTIRTGSADFGAKLLQAARRRGFRRENGQLIDIRSKGKRERHLETPTEKSFFDAINVAWVDPEDR